MKKAFTLAEVLITLGIIGVVAAMTLPTLIYSYKKQVTVTKIKKITTVLSQAMLFAAPDGDWDSIPLKDGGNAYIEEWFLQAIKPHIQVAKYCVDTAGCWNSGTKQLNGHATSNDRGAIGIGGNILVFVTNDGNFICMDAWSGSDITSRFGVNTLSDGLSIYVDINGDGKPNVIGKDVFVYVYTQERGLLPAGRDLSDAAVSNSCKLNSTGVYCLENLIRNNWNIKKDFII